MKEKINRNHMLDAVKAVSAIGVVLVHFPFPGLIGNICGSVGVTGVIVFFLISGYQSYFDRGSDCSKLLHRFRRNFNLTLVAVLVHFIFTVIQSFLFGNLETWVNTHLLNPVTYVRMIVLGDFSFINGDHLWYLVAMLYSYLILYIMEKYRLHNIFYKLLPLLLCVRVVMETYTNSYSHFSWLDWHFSGNAIIGGFPVMLLGNYIRSHEKKFSLSRNRCLLYSILSFLILSVAVNVKIIGLDISQPFKIALAVFVFLLCLKTPLSEPVVFLGKLGNRYSLHIYVWHFIVGVFVREILIFLEASNLILDWFLPILIIVVSVLLSLSITESVYAVKKIKFH